MPAAGSGVRLGAGLPKAFVELDGRTMLERAVAGLLDSGVVDDVVAVVPADRVDESRTLLAPLGVDGHVVVVTTGGAERTDSVRNGLAALTTAHAAPGDGPVAQVTGAVAMVAGPASSAGGSGTANSAVYDVLLVHDAARCLTPAQPIRRVVEAVRAGEVAVVPVVPVVDTVKQVDAAGDVATDDAGLVERLGHRVATVDGDPLAFKVTTGEDRLRAEIHLASERSLADGPQSISFGWRPYRPEPGSEPPPVPEENP